MTECIIPGKLWFRDLFGKKIKFKKNDNIEKDDSTERTIIDPNENQETEITQNIEKPETNEVSEEVHEEEVNKENTSSEEIVNNVDESIEDSKTVCPCTTEVNEEESHEIIDDEDDRSIWGIRDDVFYPTSEEKEPEFIPVDTFATICVQTYETEKDSVEENDANV